MLVQRGFTVTEIVHPGFVEAYEQANQREQDAKAAQCKPTKWRANQERQRRLLLPERVTQSVIMSTHTSVIRMSTYNKCRTYPPVGHGCMYIQYT